MNFIKKYWQGILVGTLIFSNIVVWNAVFERQTSNVLKVYFLDVGQGDAIFIDSPRHGRILVDGGKNKKILDELGKILPFADTRIDVVIATHPDADHIGGLLEVISRYDVGLFLEPGVETDKYIESELKRRLEKKNVSIVIARRGQVINIGDGVKLVILFPNQDVSRWDTNDASIVAKLIYGEESFLLTGDSTIRAENILLSLDADILKSTVLKAGHHGSRTSTSPSYAQAVSPAYAVISASENNSYGHPHKEVLDILEKVAAKVLSTVNFGTIRFETNGETLEIK